MSSQKEVQTGTYIHHAYAEIVYQQLCVEISTPRELVKIVEITSQIAFVFLAFTSHYPLSHGDSGQGQPVPHSSHSAGKSHNTRIAYHKHYLKE